MSGQKKRGTPTIDPVCEQRGPLKICAPASAVLIVIVDRWNPTVANVPSFLPSSASFAAMNPRPAEMNELLKSGSRVRALNDDLCEGYRAPAGVR